MAKRHVPALDAAAPAADAYDWIITGATVAVISGRYSDQVTVTTVERITARDVILENGQRFRLTSHARYYGHALIRGRGAKQRAMTEETAYLVAPNNGRVLEIASWG